MIGRALLTLLLSVFLTSCCNSACYNYCTCVEGAAEFVTDSYKIRQGKLAILEMQGVCVGELPNDAMCEYQDSIYEDDILNIMVFHPTRKDLMESIRTINETIGFRVKNGEINIPDIQAICVRGLPLEMARGVIERAVRDQVGEAEVFLSYRDRLSRKVELAGLVKTASIPVDGKIRLYDVLSRAGIPPCANFFMSYVSRCNCPLPLDISKLMLEGDMCQNIVMRGGDKVFIADDCEGRATVMGEVMKPTAIPLPKGYISLREALVAAGGIPFTGNRDCIQIIRGNLPSPKIYVLSWEHIVNLPNDSLLLMPGDTVYVSERPITQWNRFISQLLPSLSGAMQGFGAYKLFYP